MGFFHHSAIRGTLRILPPAWSTAAQAQALMLAPPIRRGHLRICPAREQRRGYDMRLPRLIDIGNVLLRAGSKNVV